MNAALRTNVVENLLVERLTAGFERPAFQLNRRSESDAELFRLPGSSLLLALTTDAVVEEIEAGLYDDPHLIGWMAVIVNASDLAAVGAEPLGLLLNQTLTPGLEAEFLAELQRGVADACAACDLAVLGGDTNFSSHLQISATALGRIADGEPLTRRGCSPGDRLFASGALGLGGAYALAKLVRGFGETAVPYRPAPRLREGQLLRGYATACMDTSDGVIPTLDELMRLNAVGFRLERSLEEILHPAALRAARALNLPAWSMLAGPHGEFELLFTLPAARSPDFRVACEAIGWRPLEMGVVSGEPGLRFREPDGPAQLDTGRLRNLFVEVGGDVQAYVRELIQLDAPADPSDKPALRRSRSAPRRSREARRRRALGLRRPPSPARAPRSARPGSRSRSVTARAPRRGPRRGASPRAGGRSAGARGGRAAFG